jgi:signal transduction histidine kinase
MEAMTRGAAVNVLLIDDQEASALALQNLLSEFEVCPYRAESSSQAFAHVEHHEFALVLMQTGMTSMDCLQVALHLRNLQHMGETPILLLAKPGMADMHLYTNPNLGTVDLLMEPIEPNVLRTKVTLYCKLYEQAQIIRKQEAVIRRHGEELESRITERTAKLEDKVHELERFALTIAHDLQAPLNTITSSVQRLAMHEHCKDSVHEDAFTQHFVQQALLTTRHMKGMIRSVLNYSGLHERVSRFTQVDLGQTLQEVVADLEAEICRKDTDITIDALPVVEGDPDLLRELFENILSNSLKFCDGKRPSVRIASKRSQDGWLCSVQDNGVGIPSEDLQYVFHMFRRGTHDVKHRGYGIGLAICHRIVELHSGKIWVESVPNEGATFCIHFPSPAGISVDNYS